jgi:hypothetical protein
VRCLTRASIRFAASLAPPNQRTKVLAVYLMRGRCCRMVYDEGAMRASSVGISYRPVRIGWCVRNNNWDDLRRAIRLSHTLWGGRFNPLIPVGNVAIAKPLVKLFRVDALYPVAEEGLIEDFIATFPWLPWPSFRKALFVTGEERTIAEFLDIYHVVRHIFEQEIRGKSNPTFSATQFEWDTADPLRDIFLAFLGGYPPKDEIHKDYSDFVSKNLLGKTIQLAIADQVDPVVLKAITPSVLTNYWVEWDASPVRAGDGVYVGEADDFEDIVNFWNLRAADAELIFFDPRHRERLVRFKDAFVEPFSKRTANAPTFEPQMSVWSKEGRDVDLAQFKLDNVLCNMVSEATWNGFNLKPTRFHIGRSKASFGTITENGQDRELSVQLPEKPFFEDIELHEQKLVASVSSIGLYSTEDESTLKIPFLPILNAFCGRRMYSNSQRIRIEIDGIGIITSVTRNHVNLRSIPKRELISEIFRGFGMNAEVSAPGRIASRLIAQMGGIQGCRVFKIPGVRDLLEAYGPQTPFERTNAIQKIGRCNPNTGVPNFSEYEGLFIESRESGPLKPDHALTFLLKRGVFQVGLTFSCPHCELEPWIPLDDLATEVRCEYCGKAFLTTPLLRDRNWRYRRSGLFGRDNSQEGSIPVVLTLQQLDTIVSMENLFVTNMTIAPITANIEPCETDFVLIEQRFWDERISIAIGECKTRNEISDDDVRKLSLVATALEENGLNCFLVFSKLAAFTAEEIARCRAAQPHHEMRVIMLTDRELEPYFVYERTEQEFQIRSSAISLKNLAECTDSIYFHPKPKAKPA